MRNLLALAWYLVLAVVSVSNAAFDPSNYLRSQQLDPSLSIYWTLQSNSIKLAIQVPILFQLEYLAITPYSCFNDLIVRVFIIFSWQAKVNGNGWLGFGIAEGGAMQGADIVYYQSSAPTTVTDAYALEFAMPVSDISQDWTLLATSTDGGLLTVEVSRLIDTQDPQDLKLVDDSWPAIDGTRVIAAWGSSPYIMYHGTADRVTGQVRPPRQAAVPGDSSRFNPVNHHSDQAGHSTGLDLRAMAH